MHEVLVNRLGGLSLPRKSVVRLTDRPDMTLDVYRGQYTTTTTTVVLKLSLRHNLYRMPSQTDGVILIFSLVGTLGGILLKAQ